MGLRLINSRAALLPRPSYRPLRLRPFAEHATMTAVLVASCCSRTEQGEMITDIRASQDRAVQMAKITKRVTWHTFRHTYTGTRLQTPESRAGAKGPGRGYRSLLKAVIGSTPAARLAGR